MRDFIERCSNSRLLAALIALDLCTHAAERSLPEPLPSAMQIVEASLLALMLAGMVSRFARWLRAFG